MKHFFIILFLSILALTIHGYQFAVSDQEISIPIILKFYDNSLFQNDLLLNQSFQKTSISYGLAALLMNFAKLQTIFFIGYVIFQFIFFFSIFRLAKVFLKDSKLAYLSLLPFFLPKFIGGTANFTFDTFFGHRTVGLIFLIFFLIYLLEKKLLKATVVALLGIWVHPLSTIPSLMLLPVFILKNRKAASIIKIILISVLILLPYLFFSRTDSPILPNLRDQQWLSILKLRAPYLFQSLWNQRGWLSLGLYVTLIFLFVGNLKRETKRSIVLIIVTSFLIFTANYLFLDIAKIPATGQFQLVRSVFPLAYLGLVLSPFFLIEKKSFLRIFGVITFVALSLNLFIVLVPSILIFAAIKLLSKPEIKNYVTTNFTLSIFILFFSLYLFLNIDSYNQLSSKIQFPKRNNDWIDLQLWALDNTKPDDVFLVPPQQTGFRVFSKRPIVGDIKDGAAVIYNPIYATYWSTLMTQTINYEDLKREDFERLAKKYEFDYFVTLSEKILNGEIIYKNNSFTVHKF